MEGFTQIADRLEPEELAALLNKYVGEMARIAEEHGGMVEQFDGDGITVLFGVPIANDIFSPLVYQGDGWKHVRVTMLGG